MTNQKRASNKRVRDLHDKLKEQGAEIVKTRKGRMVRHPSGTQVLIHDTYSDGRALHNERAYLRRAGFTL